MNARILCSITLLFSFECSSASDQPISDVDAAYERWRSSAESIPYTFVFLRNCKCVWDGIRLSVFVEYGVSSFDHPNADEFFAFPNQTYAKPNMAGIFDLVRTLTDLERRGSGLVDVEYDSTMGFPAKVRWQAADSEERSFSLTIEDVIPNDKRSRESVRAYSDLRGMALALKFYYMDCGELPPPTLGLRALERPDQDHCQGRRDAYLEHIPADPWGNQYIYRPLGGPRFKLLSLGSDGEIGGAGESLDLRIVEPCIAAE